MTSTYRTPGARLLSAFGTVLLASLLSACGNAYRAPPPQPPPDLTVLYGVDPESRSLYTLDTALGVHSIVGSPGPSRLDDPAAMAIRPADGEIFVYNNAENTGVRSYWGLVRLDRCTGFATRMGPDALPRTEMTAMAFAPDGQLVSFGQAQARDGSNNHMLYELDPDTGDFTAIGPVEGSAQYSISAADFHPDGDLYAIGTLADASGSNLQFLLIVDTETGRPSIVGEISPEIAFVSAIAFKPSGKLLGTGAYASGGRILFEINVATGGVSSVRRATVAARGMGFAPPLRC